MHMNLRHIVFRVNKKQTIQFPKGEPITTYNYTELIVPNLSRIH